MSQETEGGGGQIHCKMRGSIEWHICWWSNVWLWLQSCILVCCGVHCSYLFFKKPSSLTTLFYSIVINEQGTRAMMRRRLLALLVNVVAAASTLCSGVLCLLLSLSDFGLTLFFTLFLLSSDSCPPQTRNLLFFYASHFCFSFLCSP